MAYSWGLLLVLLLPVAWYVRRQSLQEFVARGVIQTSLERFPPRSGRAVHLALASAFFGVYHLHVSLGFAFLTFAIGLLFGALHARHRTLVGVTLAHASLGLASVAVGLN